MSQTIQVTLPSSTLYVSGSVNGVETTWTNTEGDTWETVAERADSEVYLVELTIVNAQGLTTEKSVTLYYGLLNLITDRTQADVYRVQQLRKKGWANMTEDERTEFLSPMKGAYNASDLNRVESATRFVNEYLNALQAELDAERQGLQVAPDAFFLVPYDPLVLSFKNDWTAEDIPTESDMARYLGNVDAVSSQIPIDKKLPATMFNLTASGANEIEKALLTEHKAAQDYAAWLKSLMANIAAAFLYSGEIYGGEV